MYYFWIITALLTDNTLTRSDTNRHRYDSHTNLHLLFNYAWYRTNNKFLWFITPVHELYPWHRADWGHSISFIVRIEWLHFSLISVIGRQRPPLFLGVLLFYWRITCSLCSWDWRVRIWGLVLISWLCLRIFMGYNKKLIMRTIIYNTAL